MTQQENPAPIPSATIMLLRQREEMEVLMVERGAKAVFGSAHVFPGGKLDAADTAPHWHELTEGAEHLSDLDRGLRIASWRELHEETGLLPEACLPGRSEDTMAFEEIVRRSGARLPLHHLAPFGRWITPKGAKWRFDTHFFLCPLDAGEGMSDGFETVSLEWIAPSRALEAGATGALNLMFPTKCQLQRLARHRSIEEAIADANMHPVVPIEPVWEQRDGRTYVRMPENCGYDIAEQPVEIHRSLGTD